MAQNNSGNNNGQIVNANNISGGVHYNSGERLLPNAQEWAELAKDMQSRGAADRLSLLFELQQQLNNKETEKAKSTWAKMKDLFSPALQLAANISQIVGTIDSFIYHG